MALNSSALFPYHRPREHRSEACCGLFCRLRRKIYRPCFKARQKSRRSSEILTGAGILSGVLTTGAIAEEWVSVPQWDVHLLSSYEHRNFFGAKLGICSMSLL